MNNPLSKPNGQQATLDEGEARFLARQIAVGNESHYNFTNLANKRLVQKLAKELNPRVKFVSRTAHGSLLDPRYTVEGRHIPDKGLANNYKHYTPKLYVLEVERNHW